VLQAGFSKRRVIVADDGLSIEPVTAILAAPTMSVIVCARNVTEAVENPAYRD
jgi:hypothetical protein